MNIFIDTEDMEERYGEELYKEYLERENKELKQKIEYYENFEINKTIDKIRVENNKRFKEQQEEIESLKQINEEHQRINGELRVENDRLNNIINDLLNRQNEALKYISNFLSMDNRYKHGNGNDELELVRRILNKHNEELKGSDKE